MKAASALPLEQPNIEIPGFMRGLDVLTIPFRRAFAARTLAVLAKENA